MAGGRWFAGWFCAAVCLPAAALAQPPLTLAALERMALERHPALAAAEAGIAAADARAEQAGRWPNPSIGYTPRKSAAAPRSAGVSTASSWNRCFPSAAGSERTAPCGRAKPTRCAPCATAGGCAC